MARALALSGRGQSGYEVVDELTARLACARLAELGRARAAGDDTPFMMQVGFILPHCPFVARPADYDRFAGRIGPPRLAPPAREHPWVARWRAEGCTEGDSPGGVLRARTAYWGLVHALDRRIGQVLAALRDAGLCDNTLIVYASDHGEHAGERGLWWKNTMFEESAGIPLILAWPGRLPEGARCDRVVNLIDVGATLIDAAGAPPLPRSHGRSLLGIAPRSRRALAGRDLLRIRHRHRLGLDRARAHHPAL
ncbi:MAG: hypothetical protein KatS3mg118_0179 [Paracoccaceae bacterium]|nr:MAG: hypothetical protein KatS3mg118_0179 [Paracoccaceae bacterium]